MPKKGNPYRVFWEVLKGRGYHVENLYVVALEDHELAELDELSEKYPDVKRTIDHIWRKKRIVYFRVIEISKTLDKRNLKEK